MTIPLELIPKQCDLADRGSRSTGGLGRLLLLSEAAAPSQETGQKSSVPLPGISCGLQPLCGELSSPCSVPRLRYASQASTSTRAAGSSRRLGDQRQWWRHFAAGSHRLHGWSQPGPAAL